MLGPDPICRYYFGKCSPELATLVLISYGYQCSSHSSILIGYLIFLSPFLDVVWEPISTVSFVIKLKSGIMCLHFFLHEVLGLKGYPWARPIYRYYFGKCLPDFAGLVLIPHQSCCSTHLLL